MIPLNWVSSVNILEIKITYLAYCNQVIATLMHQVAVRWARWVKLDRHDSQTMKGGTSRFYG